MANEKLEVLVVEDNPIHQESAREQLGTEHNLTVVGSFDDAKDLLVGEYVGSRQGWARKNTYDVVLTDLMLPQGRGECQRDRSRANEIQPFGYAIALIASKLGTKYVGVITDTNHHDDAMAYTIDFLGGVYSPMQMGDRKAIFANQSVDISNDKYKGGKGGKNWKQVLNALRKE